MLVINLFCHLRRRFDVSYIIAWLLIISTLIKFRESPCRLFILNGTTPILLYTQINKRTPSHLLIRDRDLFISLWYESLFK